MENKNNELETILKNNNIKNIFYIDEINVKDLIKEIKNIKLNNNEKLFEEIETLKNIIKQKDDELTKYKNNNLENKKMILIIGCKNVGKTTILSNFQVVKNNNFEFTYQILRNIQNEYKNDKIYLVIGDDLLRDFDKWKNISEILKYNIIVIKRNNIDESIYKKYEKYNFIVTNKISSKEISSTIVRNMIVNGNKDVLKYIDLKVYDYIKRNNLYVS